VNNEVSTIVAILQLPDVVACKHNPWVLAGLAAFLVIGILFIGQERRSWQPMLPLSLFKHRLFALATLVGFLVNVAFCGLIFVLSLYFQRFNGFSALATGLAFVPMMGAVLPANLLAARATESTFMPGVRESLIISALLLGCASVVILACENARGKGNGHNSQGFMKLRTRNSLVMDKDR